MRGLHQLREDKKRHEARIAELEAEDALYPDDPVHTPAIHGLRDAIAYIDRRIADIEQE